MKTLNKIASILALLTIVFSCQKPVQEEPEKDYLNVEGLQAETVLPYDQAEAVTFTVESNKTWTIGKKNMDWLTVTPSNGSAGQKVTVSITASANGETEREGTLEVYAGDMKETFKVKQAARPIVPTVTVTGLTNNAVTFGYNSADPVKFSVISNVEWTIEKTNLDWLTVSPVTGELNKSVEVSLTAAKNEGAERSGTLTVKGQGADAIVINVSQGKLAPVLSVKDLTNNTISFAAVPSAPVKFRLNTNYAWTIVPSADWLTVTPASGNASDTDIEINVTAAANTGEAREGSVTVKSSNSELSDVVITVKQEGASAQETVLAQFTLSDEKLKANDATYPDATWADHGIMHSDDGKATGKINFFKNTPATLDPDPIISSDGNGHYAVKWLWTGDYIEWSIPVSNLAAGSKVNIRFGISGKKQVAKFWNIEYFDNGEWKLTSSQEFMAGNDGTTPVKATFALPGTDVIVNVDENATFSQAVVNGNIRIRLLCVDGTFRTDTGKTQGFTEGGHNTIRIRQWNPEGTPAGENNAIKFTLIK